VKNLFDVAGHTTLAGAELFSQRPAAAADSFAVRQLRSAGGLLSGMVNMDAYAYGFTTENSHYGATHNPHDLKRIAGDRPGISCRRRRRAGPFFARHRHQRLDSRTGLPVRDIWSEAHLWPPVTFRQPSVCRKPGSYRAVCPPRQRLASVYDALQGRDTSDSFQADSSREQTRPLLDRGLDGLRCAVLGGYFSTWCDADARAAVARVAKALDAHDELLFPDAELARSAAFIISASEGEISTCLRFEASPRDLSLTPASGCWQGR
jgi:aspartyl-tRNA(Asn)/glutamyl-tRNA(Gln) amidotransferase subunit A